MTDEARSVIMCDMSTMTDTKWIRQPDGTYTRNGWTITKTHYNPNRGQPAYTRQNTHARTVYRIDGPGCPAGMSADTVRTAKMNADQQMIYAAMRAAGVDPSAD